MANSPSATRAAADPFLHTLMGTLIASVSARSSACMNCCRGISPASEPGWISATLPEPVGYPKAGLTGRLPRKQVF